MLVAQSDTPPSSASYAIGLRCCASSSAPHVQYSGFIFSRHVECIRGPGRGSAVSTHSENIPPQDENGIPSPPPPPLPPRPSPPPYPLLPPMFRACREGCVATFPHPTFVTSVHFCGGSNDIFMTGCFDKILRKWSIPERRCVDIHSSVCS